MTQKRNVLASVKSHKRVNDRRAQLISAAIKVFLEKGFHGATVREIGAAAGLTQGTIYNYVRSKDDILYLVCDHVVDAYHQGVRRELSRHNLPTQRIEAVIRALIEVMHKHQDYILLLYRESHALDRRSLKAILARVEEFHHFIEHIVCEGADAPPFPIRSPALIANIITYLPTIVVMRRWLLPQAASHEEVVEGLVEFMMRGLNLRADSPTNTSG